MRNRFRFLVSGVAFGGALLAAPSAAQRVQETVLVENPSRDIGGSCVYGRSGELLFAPQGASCPQRQQPPASATPSAERARPAPASLRAEAQALLVERERMDAELARVREAVAYEDRESAARVIDEALRTLARHLEREARLLEPLAAGAAPAAR